MVNLYSKKLEPSETLSDIRNKMKIEDQYSFQTNDGFDILKEDEKEYTIKESLIDNNKIILKKTNKKKINIPIEGSKKVGNKNNLDLYLYPVIKELTKEEEEKAITLIFMGELGSGKTTLLNSYINYIMGINYEDDFRYILINDQFNQFNTDVNIYNIKAQDGKIFQIVDTPGFGSIKQDIEISKKIRQIIIDKLLSITCICFVNKANYPRLTCNQKYIFNNVLDLLGDDIKSNFNFMLTFSDGSKPMILGVLQESVFHEIIPYIESPWFCKFNNSAIFVKDKEDEFNSNFYDLGMKSFENFTLKVGKLKKKSLDRTKEVLKERENLEEHLKVFQLALDKINEIKELLNTIKSDKRNKNDAENKIKLLYYDSKSKIDIKSQILLGVKKDLTALNKKCLDIQDLIIKGIDKLKEIALNKNNILALNEEFIEELIQFEISDKKPGYRERIEGLGILKSQKKVLREIIENKNCRQLDDINKLIENL